MNRNREEGVLGIFAEIDAAVEAIEGLKAEGLTRIVTFSPMPSHDLEHALHPAPSPVRMFTLIGGLTGAATGFALPTLTSLDWPLVTGGKPIISIPPMVIIAFELMILFAALSTVAGLFINARLPRARSQVIYDPSFSAGHFGVFVSANGNAAKAREIMMKSGATSVRDKAEEVRVDINSLRVRSTALLLPLSLAFFSAGCTNMENALSSIPVFSFLRNAPSFDPYEAPRPAPFGSVPFNTPAGESLGPLEATETALNEFAGRITNPLAANDTLALKAGQVMFERHCAVCHNADAKGNGPIVGQGKFPMGPNLTLPQTVARSDGYIYALIRAGRGLMPSYGPRMSHLERWATVNYLRQLQAAAGAQPQVATPAAAPVPTATAQ